MRFRVSYSCGVIITIFMADDILNGIRHIPMLRPDHDKPNPKTAISAKFNGSGKLMLTLSGRLLFNSSFLWK